MDNEQQLLVRARRLNTDALAQIHHQYYQPIFRYIYFRVSDQKVAEDLTSDVFIRLLSALRDRTAPQNSIRGWLYRVASNVVNDHYRRQNRAVEVELSDMLPDNQTPPLEEEMQSQLSAEKLYKAMGQLTKEQQNVLSLRFGFGMRIREVAQTIGKSEGAVKQLQVRALASLSRQLTKGETAS